ncbi:hypothetical protein BIZ92_27185 [Achromobacter xylosoxidans]|uniref:Uncharacterized protein n=1 Tax=Alcaligenes xylosoxydans xylosoxydans TaxID=85698 RepID=A0A1R1JSF5_ALCXX|nr:hypothetical protein BIZ92_27185 [Achromobacter xylosoxidans]
MIELVLPHGPLRPAKLMPACFITERDTSTTLTSTCTTPPVPAVDTSTTFLSPTAAPAAATEAWCVNGDSAWPDTTARSPATSTLAPPATPRPAMTCCTLPATRTVQTCGAALAPVQICNWVVPAFLPYSSTDACRLPEAASTLTSATSGSPMAMRTGAPSSMSACWPLTATAMSRAGALAPAAEAVCARLAAPQVIATAADRTQIREVR